MLLHNSTKIILKANNILVRGYFNKTNVQRDPAKTMRPMLLVLTGTQLYVLTNKH